MKQLFFLLFVGIAFPLVAQTPQEQPVAQAPAPEKVTAATSQATAGSDKTAAVSGKTSAAPATDAQTPAAADAAKTQSDLAQDLAAAAPAQEEKPAEEFVAVRETVEEEDFSDREKVVYSPKGTRDPMLSPDDFLLLQYREQQRLAAIEAERKRKEEEERRRQEEAERLRQLELARIKDPTREVRNKIRIGGVIGQEVFIGSKIYTVGNTIFGARIIAVRPDEVVFSYKGHKFVRKVQL